MKRIILTSLLLVPAFAILSCGENTNTNTVEKTEPDTPVVEKSVQQETQVSEDIDAAKFKTFIDKGDGIILDVRTPGEYANGNIGGSINIDFRDAGFAASVDTLDKTKPVYVYCQSGGRSGQAKEILINQGFTKVYNLVGGYGNWPYKN